MYKILSYISLFSVLVPLLLGFIKVKILNKTLRILLLYLIVSACAELLSKWFADRSKTGYFITQNIFTLIECIALFWIFSLEYKNRRVNRFILISFGMFVLLAGWDFIWHKYKTLSVNTTCFESFIMVLLAIGYFYKVQHESVVPDLRRSYFFWLNCAILLYFATSLILFLSIDYLQHTDKETFQRLWSLHLIGNISYNGLMAISLWTARLK